MPVDAEVTIRPLVAEDRAALAEGFRRLSPESRYRRFFAPVAELSEHHLDLLMNVDHHDHEALVALAPGGEELIGVARYVRTEPDEAEPAIVVADEWQGRGVGTRLLRELAARARQEGITRFEALVLATNDDVIHLLSQVGRAERHGTGPEVQIAVELGDAERPAADATALLRQAAVGALAPARTLIELLWPRRPPPARELANLIVVGVDGSSHAEAAVRTAGALAAVWGARVSVVGVQRLPVGGEVADAVRAAARLIGERVEVNEHVVSGDPAFALTDLAQRHCARLIAIGAGERRPAVRRLIGSVADAVAARAPCAVLIVRPPRL